MRERIGRLTFRESAIAIKVALDMALENQTAVPEKAAEAAPDVRDVLGDSGNHHAMPPPHKRRGAR